jgi:hypothetical protein
MSRLRKRPSDEALHQAIKGSGGIIGVIAKKAGVCRESIYRWRKESKQLEQWIQEEREGVLDLAEVKLIKLIEKEDGPSVRFYLQTMGKNRGYVKRTELEGEIETKGQVVVFIPDNGRSPDDAPAPA